MDGPEGEREEGWLRSRYRLRRLRGMSSRTHAGSRLRCHDGRSRRRAARARRPRRPGGPARPRPDRRARDLRREAHRRPGRRRRAPGAALGRSAAGTRPLRGRRAGAGPVPLVRLLRLRPPLAHARPGNAGGAVAPAGARPRGRRGAGQRRARPRRHRGGGPARGAAGDRGRALHLVRPGRPLARLPRARPRRLGAGRRLRHHRRRRHAAAQAVRRTGVHDRGDLRRDRRAGRAAPRARDGRGPDRRRRRARGAADGAGARADVRVVLGAGGVGGHAGPAAAGGAALDHRLPGVAGAGGRHHGHPHARPGGATGLARRGGLHRGPARSEVAGPRPVGGVRAAPDGRDAGLGAHEGGRRPVRGGAGAPRALRSRAAARAAARQPPTGGARLVAAPHDRRGGRARTRRAVPLRADALARGRRDGRRPPAAGPPPTPEALLSAIGWDER